MPKWMIWVWIIGIYIGMIFVSAFIFMKIEDSPYERKNDVGMALLWPFTLPIIGIICGGEFVIDFIEFIVSKMVDGTKKKRR